MKTRKEWTDTFNAAVTGLCARVDMPAVLLKEPNVPTRDATALLSRRIVEFAEWIAFESMRVRPAPTPSKIRKKKR